MPGEADLELVEKIWSPRKKAVVAGSSVVEEQPDQRENVLAENRGFVREDQPILERKGTG